MADYKLWTKKKKKAWSKGDSQTMTAAKKHTEISCQQSLSSFVFFQSYGFSRIHMDGVGIIKKTWTPKNWQILNCGVENTENPFELQEIKQQSERK